MSYSSSMLSCLIICLDQEKDFLIKDQKDYGKQWMSTRKEKCFSTIRRREGEEPQLDLRRVQRENKKVLQDLKNLKNFMTKRKILQRKE